VADVTRAWLIFSESAGFPAGREYDSRCGLERGPASDGANLFGWFAVWHFFEHEGISFQKKPLPTMGMASVAFFHFAQQQFMR